VGPEGRVLKCAEFRRLSRLGADLGAPRRNHYKSKPPELPMNALAFYILCEIVMTYMFVIGLQR
jgi:hypothetical protein